MVSELAYDSCYSLRKAVKISALLLETMRVADNVEEFPLSEERALKMLRDAAAKDSRKLVNTIRYERDEIWFEVVSNNQILLCLTEGRIVGGIKKDDHGNWVCVVTRLCGGLDVYVTVPIDTGDNNRVYVLKVENRQ